MMAIIDMFLIPIFLVLLASSFFIARKVYKTLKMRENRWAIICGILTFVVVAGTFFLITVFVIDSTVDFGRD